MAGIEVKSFAQPDEFQELPRFIKEEVVVGGVHVATRVAGLAQAGEVLVSQSAVALLDGSDIPLRMQASMSSREFPGGGDSIH